MRLRVGLAVLFAAVAFVPFALAVEWNDDAMETVAREAANERADAIAAIWSERVSTLMAAIESEAREACERSGADGLTSTRLAGASATLDRIVPGGTTARSTLRDAPATARTAMAREWTVVDLAARSRPEPTLARAVECGGATLLVAIDPRELSARLGLHPGRGAGTERAVRTFAGAGGAEPFTLTIAIGAPELDLRAHEQVALRLQILALATLLVALVIGFVVGGRLASPLGELERAAERIGKGDLEVHIDRAGGSAGATFSAFNRMTRELKDAQNRARRAERVAAWRDIARRIAHEIKNPLTPIRMSMETMRRTKQRQHPDFDEIFEESTKTVLEEVERLERIVTEFSRFARLPRPRPTPIDVREVIAQVVQLHDPGGDSTITETSPRLPVKMTLPNALPKVRVDRDQLTQVLVNLVQNAIDAARSKRGEQGHVEVEAEETEDGVRVTVSDDGPGIPEEERAHVLEPYYTTKAGGTGLGLAIVDRIVSEHGGWLEIGESRRGGAAFALTLTREGPPDDAEASQTS